MCWEFPTKKEQAEEFQNRINMRAVTMNIVEINKKVMNNLIVFLGSHSSKLLKFAKYDKTFVYQRGGKEKKWGNMTEDEWYQYRIDFLQDPDETEVGTLPLPPSTIEGWFNNDRTQENWPAYFDRIEAEESMYIGTPDWAWSGIDYSKTML